MEIIVGVVTLFITFIFIALFLMLTMNAGLKYVTFIVGAILLLFIYWFGLVSYRLLFNAPNRSGGLFSVGGFKFWCVFLGLSSLAVVPLSLYMGHWGAAAGSVCLSYGCYKGWYIAGSRVNA